MKKTICLIIALFVSVIIFANQKGHFFHNVESDNIQLSNIEKQFNSWIDLPTNTTFRIFRDETDDLGIRHISYQQYVDGIMVGNGIIIVHEKGGKVYAVNGNLLERKETPSHLSKEISPLDAIRKVRKNTTEDTDIELKIIRTIINGKEVYRYAYEVMADDFTAKCYVDVETSEIIKIVPLVFNADVAGTANTMYNGIQAITCYEKEGKYFLLDEARGIITLDATNNKYEIDYNTINQAKTLEEYKNLFQQELENLINGCSSIYNTSTNWTSTWEMQLKNVTIQYVLQNSTWYVIGEDAADLYIKIKDEDGNVLYQSGYYENPTYPVSFDLPTPISMSYLPYIIEVWDYDPIGDDDLVETKTISSIIGSNSDYQWGQTAIGLYTIESNGKQPLFDAHWGMEKTLDFFKETFNRKSFDNKGSIVYNVVNLPYDNGEFKQIYMNAVAVSTVSPFPMIYGMGINSVENELFYASMKPVVSIDIMAHEFTHLVTNHNGNGGLEYLGEAGALNESFSDIFGIAVKKYATGHNDWLIGSDVMMNVSNIRSLKSPHNSNDGISNIISSPLPDTYYGRYWKDTHHTTCDTCDKGGVHRNSGVQNYWFYLLSEGGFGTNDKGYAYNVKAIGMDKAIQIAYRNLSYFLTPEATYEDARKGSIQAAIDLYGENSQEHKSVIDAWNAVGVNASNEITISAKMPEDWESTISAWTWGEGNSGSWVSLSKNNGRYEYSIVGNELNIIFVNGNTWNGDNNQTVDITINNSACISIGNETSGKRSFAYTNCSDKITIKAKMPTDWGNTISAWTWGDGNEGSWATLQKDGDWYSYTSTESPLNIVFVNGTNWNGDNNQSVDISITENTCIQLNNNTTGKRSYSIIDCKESIGTAVEKANTTLPATKILRNGKVFILRGDKVYTLQGQEVR